MKLKTLIVDDNKQSLYMLERIFKGLEYEVVTAANGKEALDKLSEGGFAMIISDALMPVMDGFKLCRKVKTNQALQEILFIFYTATYTDEKDEEFALKIGADRFLRKPMEPDAFARIIREIAENKTNVNTLSAEPALVGEEDVLRQYSERLINKLEDKTIKLEKEITNRKKVEEKLKQLNSVLRSIRNVNRLIVKEKNRDRLIKDACQVLVESRFFHNVWIMLLDETKKMTAAAETGLGKAFQPVAQMLRDGRLINCVRKAYAQPGTVVINDPVSACKNCPLAIKYKGRTGLCIRLERDGKTYGILSASVIKDLVSDKEVSSLFEEIGHDISLALAGIEEKKNRKRIENALQVSEEQYRGIFASATDAFLVFNLQGDVVDANPAACEIYGYSYDELTHLSGKDIVHPDYCFLFEKFTEQIEATGRFRAESTDVRKNGSTLNVEVRGTRFNYLGKTHLLAVVRDITKRKQAEMAIINAKEEWERTFNAVPDLIAIIDNNHRIVRTNKAMADKLGVSPDKAVGLTCYERVHGTEAPPLFCPHTKLLADGQGHSADVHEERLGGDYFVTVSPLHNSANRLIGSVHVARDVTERNKAEKALRESEKKYRDIFENVSDFIYIHDLEGYFTETNLAFLSAYGYSEDDLANLNLRDIIPEQYKHHFEDYLEEILEKGQAKGLMRIVTKEGKERSIEYKNALVYDKLGPMPIGVRGSARDITVRREAELALQESEKRYRTVMEANPDPVVVYDLEGKVVYFNPAFATVFGWSLQECIGRKMDHFVPEDNWSQTQILIEKVRTGDSFSSVELQRRTKAGNIIPVSISAAGYYDQEGCPVGSVANLRDITEQKRLEAQLQQAQKMESIGTLAGGIAHDFNNILSSVLGYTELSLLKVEKGDSLHNYLQEVLHAGNRAKELVKQILAFSRKSKTEKRPVMVELIVKEALQLLRASLPSTIEIKAEIRSDSLAMGDPTQVHQIMMNLCTNAGHAMQAKGGCLDISLKDVNLGIVDSEIPGVKKLSSPATADLNPGRYLVLTVSDTGHGIPEEVMDQIFDPYFTTKDKQAGTGLGLSVVHGIVHDMGGAITVESHKAAGTVFKILLPVVEHGAIVETSEAGEIMGGSESILIVDDEPPIMKMSIKTLASLGYKMTGRTSSIEALELFKGQPSRFDLVITDMTMPHITGTELAEKMMQIRPDVPIILCTGFSENIDEKRARKMGLSALVFKPFSARNIAEAVRKALDDQI